MSDTETSVVASESADLRRIISLGAGVQSTTMQLLAIEAELVEPVDFSVFSDTGWEHRDVYEHLDALEKWSMEQAGIPVYRASHGNLRDDVLDPTVFATIPAWTKSGGVQSVPVAFKTCPTCGGFRMLNGPEDACADCNGTGAIPTAWEDRPAKRKLGHIIRQCTPKYKIEPLDRKVRELVGAQVSMVECRYCQGTGERVPPWSRLKINGRCSICRGGGEQRLVGSVPPGTRIEQWIGFSKDEFERATTIGFPSYSAPRHPLLELGWTRTDCIRWMDERGWKGVAKSACVGCPFHDDDTWLDIADRDPRTFAELVMYDRAIRHGDGMSDERFLHESRLPLDEAVNRYRDMKRIHGDQLYLMDEFRPKRKVRHCNPFGCRSEELDDLEVAIA